MVLLLKSLFTSNCSDTGVGVDDAVKETASKVVEIERPPELVLV